MKAQLLKLWDNLHSSFWFIPSLMAGGAAVLAFAGLALDQRSLAAGWVPPPWMTIGGAEGADTVLQIVAVSMITIAGVVFSLTLVALSLASSQFGPRLLRNFMRDTIAQVVLGTFVAAFVYCLLVLRAIRTGDDPFLPHLSVSLGIILALASLWVFIYFIHRISLSIQAEEIVARIGLELDAEVDRLYPEDNATAWPAEPRLPEFGADAVELPAAADGYIDFIDCDSLTRAAVRADAYVRVLRRPGEYVYRGSPLAQVWPGDRVRGRPLMQFRGAFALGHQRTHGQDIEFAINQLVEIAARALSPGVNDPFTAIVCLDRLGAGLYHLAQRRIPPVCGRDRAGAPRVLVPGVRLVHVMDQAFSQIRQYARPHVAVTLRLLQTIAQVAPACRRPEEVAELRRQAEMILRGAGDLPEPEDRMAVAGYYRGTVAALERQAGDLTVPTFASASARAPAGANRGG